MKGRHIHSREPSARLKWGGAALVSLMAEANGLPGAISVGSEDGRDGMQQGPKTTSVITPTEMLREERI